MTLKFMKAKVSRQGEYWFGRRRNERKPNAVTCAAHEVFAKIRKRAGVAQSSHSSTEAGDVPLVR